MIILVDTREKVNDHILKYFDRHKIEYRKQKLDAGDYSFELDGASYANRIAIERKGSLTELASNFTSGRERFCREFERASGSKCKVYLMVENASWEQINKGDYRSRFSPSAFKGSLNTWCYKFQLQLDFVAKKDAGSYILQTFQKYKEENEL